MATGSLKTLNDAFVVERITVASSGSSTTYYKDFTKEISKTGYTPVGLVGVETNQASIYCYWQYIITGTIHVGLAKVSNAGTISGLTVIAHVLWVRNDLL